MSDPTHTTGFFDLPLEFRRMVYDYVLPEDRIVTFPTTQLVEEDMFNLCATHCLIHEEMMAWIYENCICYLNIVPELVVHRPLAIEFHRFQTIRIKIQHSQNHCRGISLGGIEQAIALLRYGEPTLLPNVTIQFEESNMYRDPFWTQIVPFGSTFRRSVQGEGFAASNMDCFHWSDSRRDHVSENIETVDPTDVGSDTWLRVTPDSFGPIVVEILDHFLDLPPCRHFSIREMNGVEYCGIRQRHNVKRRVFDYDYMTDILDTIRLWMTGERDGVELPKEENDWFETRLEQLAYTYKDGKFHCDGRRLQSS
jgi:hypothetical protein